MCKNGWFLLRIDLLFLQTYICNHFLHLNNFTVHVLHMLYIVIEIIESKFLQIKILGTVIFISAPLFIVKGILLRVSLHYPTLNCHGFIYQLMRLEKRRTKIILQWVAGCHCVFISLEMHLKKYIYIMVSVHTINATPPSPSFFPSFTTTPTPASPPGMILRESPYNLVRDKFCVFVILVATPTTCTMASVLKLIFFSNEY